MKELTHLSLFSGIGGLDLAAEWAGIQTVGQCEWAEYPTQVLEKHWPDVPRWKDIRTLTGESFYERTGRRTVDIISGGFPCQPFSVAGKQRGKEDDRYLWPEMVRVIKELRPTWVVGENVAGIVKMALPDILSELEACGYRTRTFLIPACAVGARHRRYRVAIVGYSEHNGRLTSTQLRGDEASSNEWRAKESEKAGKFEGTGEPRDVRCVCGGKPGSERGGSDLGKNRSKAQTGEIMANSESKSARRLPVGEKQEITGSAGCRENVSNTNSAGLKEQHFSEKSDKTEFADRGINERGICDTSGKGLPHRTGKEMGESEQKQEPERSDRRTAESILGGVADGIPAGLDGNLDFIVNHYWDSEPDIPRIATGIEHRADRLKCLGNAVVPQQFYPIFREISEITKQTKNRGRRSSRPAQMGSSPRADRFDSCWRMAQNRALKGERRWSD